jgi:hypothetical protein
MSLSFQIEHSGSSDTGSCDCCGRNSDGGQDEHQTASLTHLLLQVAPVGLALFAIMNLPSEGMQLLPFEGAAPHAPPERGIRQILEREESFIHPPELAYRPVDVIARSTGEQALEGDRRRGTPGREGGEELAQPVPLGGDPIQMHSIGTVRKPQSASCSAGPKGRNPRWSRRRC